MYALVMFCYAFGSFSDRVVRILKQIIDKKQKETLSILRTPPSPAPLSLVGLAKVLHGFATFR